MRRASASGARGRSRRSCRRFSRAVADPALRDGGAANADALANANANANANAAGDAEQRRPFDEKTHPEIRLVEADGAFALHTPAFDVTFPARPKVEQTLVRPPGHAKPMELLIASAMVGDDGGVGVTWFPVPPGEAFDQATGVDGFLGFLKQSDHRIVSDEPNKLGAYHGRVIHASHLSYGARVLTEARAAYLSGTRTAPLVVASHRRLDAAGREAADAFLASLTVR